MSDKDANLQQFLDAVHAGPQAWVVLDVWDADLCATGVAMSGNASRRVYVSTYEMPAGRFYCECEASRPGEPGEFDTVGREDDLSLEELLAKIAQHLS